MWNERTHLVLYCPALVATNGRAQGYWEGLQLITRLVSGEPLAGPPLSVWQRAEIYRKGVKTLFGL